MFIAGGGGAGSFQNIATYPSGWPPPTVPQPIANGSGGSQSSGGAAGVSGNPSYPPGNAGSQFTGGAGSPASNGKAGGGGAGYYGGGGGASDTGAANGGGAGGLRTNLTGHPLAGSAFPVSTTPGSYTITVGGGGAAGGGLATLSGGTGGNSSFGPTIVSDGGGGGASVDAPSSGKSGGYDGGGSIINSHSWVIYDTSRNVNNPSGSILAPNKAFAEENNSTDIDFLSNGFKIRTNRSNINPGSTQTVIYAAFAETPSFNLYGGQANAR
jgi:hypothetical protein